MGKVICQGTFACGSVNTRESPPFWHQQSDNVALSRNLICKDKGVHLIHRQCWLRIRESEMHPRKTNQFFRLVSKIDISMKIAGNDRLLTESMIENESDFHESSMQHCRRLQRRTMQVNGCTKPTWQFIQYIVIVDIKMSHLLIEGNEFMRTDNNPKEIVINRIRGSDLNGRKDGKVHL